MLVAEHWHIERDAISLGGYQVAACTVDRLMSAEGLSGVVRGRRHRTTLGGKDSRRAPDLLDRDFTAEAPNRKWVTDFTYCRTWAGFVYVAFVIDCFSRTIVGWHASSVKDTPMVTTALKMALGRRDHGGHAVADGLIHHSDAGSQDGFNRSSQHLNHGGARWGVVGSRCRRRRRVRGGSGRRIGRCSHRCDRRARRVRCSGISGGGSPLA
ncbi:DDE-type integrase/transposase/recombinase [Rhodococcus qingshengii]|jgi:hypothetical protein|nr:DDE-type integrase/transposase/recombinase [Rhodococcus qingshengii]MBP2521043.1 hypothetical protein [Rhodococcus sp. PvP104]MYV31809.1 DDE-type integrase/transposase/recombinase [Rhodococcus erythropolis]